MTAISAPPMVPDLKGLPLSDAEQPPSDPLRHESGRRRFAVAVSIGVAVVAVPYIWISFSLWNGHFNLLRSVSPANFYSLQARAMLDGHFYVRRGALGIEAFRHDGHEFSYFGIFPSLVRMPILMFTHRFDNTLTGPSVFCAWVLTAVFSSLLLWRIRVIAWGEAMVSRAEAIGHAVLIASITGGSVLMYLAATPYVYNEDFAWSVTLTTGSLFALLGVLEAPSRGRVATCGLLILATNLNRGTTGYACVIGAFLVAGWFAFARSNRDRRKWAIPMTVAGLVPLLASIAVTYAKFGLPFGLPMSDQVWASVNAHRRYFLAANGGKAFSPAFLPSTLVAYLQPTGIQLSSVFPYVTLPSAPARVVGNVVLDQVYPTASATASMPLLVLLSSWGIVTAFRPRGPGRIYLTRFIILAAGAGAVGVLVWGYIGNRYLADFLPLWIAAGAVGMVEVWRLLDGKKQSTRIATLAVIVALGIYGIVANIGIALTPTAQSSVGQLRNFVAAQESLSPGALSGMVTTGSVLPYWAPAGQLFIANSCSALYYSTGNRYNNVPGQQLIHATWLPVEYGPGTNHPMQVEFNSPLRSGGQPTTLLTWGKSSVVIEPVGHSSINIYIQNPSAPQVTWPVSYSKSISVRLHQKYSVVIRTDPYAQSISVSFSVFSVIHHYVAATGPAVAHTTNVTSGAAQPDVSVSTFTLKPQDLGLCHSIQDSLVHRLAKAGRAGFRS
jgi:hypothetical protein